MAVESQNQPSPFARLLTAVTTHLINLAPDEIDNGINHVLGLIGQFTRADCALVLLQKNRLLSNTHEWSAPDAACEGAAIHDMPPAHMGWILDELDQFGFVYVPNGEHLPPEAVQERRLFAAQGWQAFTAVPLVRQNTRFGLLVLLAQEQIWTNETVSLLHIVGEIFTNALQRKDFEQREKLAYELGAELATILDQDTLLNRTTNQLRDGLGYYYTQIFLANNLPAQTDSGAATHLVIQAGTGVVGERLKQKRHTIAINASRSIVARAARTREVVRVDDVREISYHLPNPVLPNTRSEVAIPLINELALIGVLDVQHTDPNHFNAHEIRILQIVAYQLSTALAKAALFAHNQQLVEELTLLHAIATAATETNDEDTLFARVAPIIAQALRADLFGFAFVDPQSGSLSYHRSLHCRQSKYLFQLIRPGEGVCGQVVATGKPRRITDVTQEPAFLGDSLTRSELCVPLKLDQQIIGVMNAESDQPGAFSEADERLLTTIAGQLANTIEKLRLFKKAQHQAAETAALLATSKAISSLQLDHVLNTIAAEAQRLFKADTCRIHLIAPDGKMLRCVVALSDRPEQAIMNFSLAVGVGITGRVALSGVPEIIRNTLEDGRGVQIPGTPEEDEAMALAPLAIRSQVIGVMTVTRRDVKNQFTPDNLQLLIAFADQAAVAIDNARLFAAEQQRAEQQQQLTKAAAALLDIRALEELGPTVTAVARQTLHADRVAIYLYNSATASAHCLYAHNLSKRYTDAITQQFRQMPANQLLASSQPVFVDNAQTDPRTAVLHDLIREERFYSFAVFALSSPQDPIGALVTYRDEVAPFDADDLAAGQTLAYIVSVTYQNILLLTEIRHALDREQRLNEITRTLNSAPDLPTILAYVTRLATDLVDADAGLLGLVIDHQIMTFYPHNIPASVNLRPVSRGSGIGWEIVETGQPVMKKRYQDHPRAYHALTKVGVGAFIGVPIIAGEESLGAMQIFSFTPGKQFSRRDLALAESIGRQAGIALQNQRLFSQLSERAAVLAVSLARQQELDEARTEFIQNVSHELRTPLGLIYGYAELLDSGALGELTAMQTQSMGIIIKRIRMLITMLDDMSALLAAETQDFRREEIDPGELVQLIQEEFLLQANQAAISLTTAIQRPLPVILGDPFHLRRVFDNLLSNAFKFTPAGGLISLKVWADGRDVLIEVTDTGSGIDPEEMQRIFERFYRAKADSVQHHQGKGTGLGLALVKEIVEAHRGRITVRSKPAEGTTFQIRLPTLLDSPDQ
ncbi:MAG: GAF domain-containing protein [Chloroflexi bacterium]|nr:GAF domain-containing protein [Chloroflexota bacterium]